MSRASVRARKVAEDPEFPVWNDEKLVIIRGRNDGAGKEGMGVCAGEQCGFALSAAHKFAYPKKRHAQRKAQFNEPNKSE